MATKIEVISFINDRHSLDPGDLVTEFRDVIQATREGKQLLTGCSGVGGWGVDYVIAYEGDFPSEEEIAVTLTKYFNIP